LQEQKSGIETLNLFHLIWLAKPHIFNHIPVLSKQKSLQQKRKSEWLFFQPAFLYSLKAFHMLTGKI